MVLKTRHLQKTCNQNVFIVIMRCGQTMQVVIVAQLNVIVVIANITTKSCERQVPSLAANLSWLESNK